MRSYPLAEARATFSKIVDRALAGEPQRITRRGQAAVVVVSEQEWQSARSASEPAAWTPRESYESLGSLLADFAEQRGFRDEDFDRSWTDGNAADVEPPVG